MTTIADVRTEPDTSTSLLRVLLIGAPLLMAVARVLLVPLDDQDWGGTMDRMAAHTARSDLGWFLAMAASGLLAITGVLLSQRVHAAGRVRAATVSMITISLGWAACAAICVSGLLLGVIAKAADRPVQIQIQKDFNSNAAGLPFLLCGLAAIGYVVLGVALARSGRATKGAAILVALGGAATLLTMPGPLTPLLVLTALLLAAGHVLTLRADAVDA